MIGKLNKIIIITLAVMFIVPCVSNAKDIFDVIGYKAQPGAGNRMEFDNIVYSGRFIGYWIEKDNDNHWDDDETGYVEVYDNRTYIADGSTAEEIFNGYEGKVDRDALEAWSRSKAKSILNIIFPGGIPWVTGQTDAEGAGNRMLKKATPKKKKAQMQALDTDFKAALEYLDLEVNNNDGQAASIILGYKGLSGGGREFGFSLPYRYSTIDDEIDSKSHFLEFDVFLKFPIIKNKNMLWNLGGDLFGSGYYLTSDAIDHAGTLKYGGGIVTSFIMDFSSAGILSMGIDYKLSKAYAFSSLVDTDNTFLDEALDWVDDLDPVHTISYGINYGIPIGDMFAVNGEVVRSNFNSDDIPDDRDSQTVAAISFSYFPSDAFELNLGFRKTFELEDIEINGIMLGMVSRF